MENISDSAIPPGTKQEEKIIPPVKKTSKFISDRTLGYVFLTAGLLIILFSTVSIFNVLTGKSAPPIVINTSAPSFLLPTQNIDAPPGSLPSGVELTESNAPPVKLISDDVYNLFLNISLYYLLMIFIAGRGASLASLGIKLIKEIKVEVKQKS